MSDGDRVPAQEGERLQERTAVVTAPHGKGASRPELSTPEWLRASHHTSEG